MKDCVITAWRITLMGNACHRGHQTEEVDYMGNQRGNPYPTNQNWN
ncbi:hypothetical protein A2U01_0077112, partial [Trifolium medium]|nr:hypothetical protein [Trifolium medium]